MLALHAARSRQMLTISFAPLLCILQSSLQCRVILVGTDTDLLLILVDKATDNMEQNIEYTVYNEPNQHVLHLGDPASNA